MPTLLITGANRGLGLEFCKQYLKDGWQIYATCRNPEQADELQQLSGDSLKVFQLDVTKPDEIKQLATSLEKKPIDMLINNAGIMGERRINFGNLSVDNLLSVFHINAIGPLKVIEAFIPNLQQGANKLVVTISSRMGSIADNTSGYHYAYRMSKAALNQAMKSAAIELADKNIKVISLHPGWVKTDMGGERADKTIPDSVSEMRSVINGADELQSGGLYAYDGSIIPW